MEAINTWCILIIYILVFVLVVLATFLGVECLKNVGLLEMLDSANFLREINGNTCYCEKKCSRLEIDGIHTV